MPRGESRRTSELIHNDEEEEELKGPLLSSASLATPATDPRFSTWLEACPCSVSQR